MNANVEAQQLLAAAGWTLVRTKGHAVWRCPCGRHTAGRSHGAKSNRLAVTYGRKAVKRCQNEQNAAS